MVFRRIAPVWAGLLLSAIAACGSSVPLAGAGDSTTPPELGATNYDACGIGNFDWQGGFAADSVSFPTIALDPATPDYVPSVVPAAFAGTILRPADTAAYPGKRPAIIIAHGEAGNQCNLWWLAHALAGAGYVALVFTQPDVNPLTSQGSSIAAIASALAFVQSAENPFAAYTDGSRIGLAGHSEGAASVAYVQGLPLASSVRAIVALDNLKHWLRGDPGTAVIECLPAKRYPVTPLVPALGFALDRSCIFRPLAIDPAIKEAGWSWWMQAGQPSMELVMKGYSHSTFTDIRLGGGSSQQLQTLAIFIQAWFDRWLGGDSSADQQLLACSANGQNTVDLLSTHYLSGAYLPALGVQDADLRALLARTCS